MKARDNESLRDALEIMVHQRDQHMVNVSRKDHVLAILDAFDQHHQDGVAPPGLVDHARGICDEASCRFCAEYAARHAPAVPVDEPTPAPLFTPRLAPPRADDTTGPRNPFALAAPPSVRTCTCLGSCKGPEGLAPGWVCAMGRTTPPPSDSPPPLVCPGCGMTRSQRWPDDTTHPNMEKLKLRDGCYYGPVYGWYSCKVSGDLRAYDWGLSPGTHR